MHRHQMDYSSFKWIILVDDSALLLRCTQESVNIPDAPPWQHAEPEEFRLCARRRDFPLQIG